MAYSDPSSWNPTKGTYGTTGVPGTDGLTDKQRDMSTARNPMNYNKLNTVESKEAPIPDKEKALPQQANPEVAKQAQLDVQQMRSKLGSAAYQVQGLVNKFLKEGTEQAKIKTDIKQVYNPTTKQYESVNASPESYDVDAAVQEKMGQIGAIKQAAQPLFEQDATGNWRAKSMAETMKGATNYATLGTAEKAQVDQLIGIAGMINEYEKKGEGKSAQTAALREQLQALDKNGTVSGMYKAIDEYQKFAGTGLDAKGKDTGMKWYGDKGDIGLGINDILSMDTKKLEAELRNSLTTGAGIFGGDYEAGLRSQVDTESAEAKAAAEEETGYRNKLLEASKAYFGTNLQTLQTNAKEIQTALGTALPSILAQLGSGPQAQAAKDFFTELATTKSEDFAGLVDTLLNDPDSGLAKEQRSQLRGMLGNITSGGSDQGDIQEWMNDLATQGYVTVHDAKGQEQKVEFNAEQKYQILQALQDNKPALIKDIFDSAMHSTEIGVSLDEALEKSKVGNTQDAVTGFAESLATSLMNFATSKTADAVRESLGISDDAWAAMTLEQKSQSISAALATPAGKSLLMDSVKRASADREKTYQDTIAKATTKLAAFTKTLTDKRASLVTTRDAIGQKHGELLDYVKGELQNKIIGTMHATTGMYTDYFNANAQAYDSVGIKADVRNQAAQALSYRDALINLRDKSPTLWKFIYRDPSIEDFLGADSKAAINIALASGSKMVPNIEALLTGLLSNDRGQIDAIVDGVPELANKKKEIFSLVSKANEQIKQVDDLKMGTQWQQWNIDEISKKLGGSVFSPDEIAKLAMQVGQNIESKAAQVGPTSVSMGPEYKAVNEKDVGQVTANMENFANTTLPEILPAGMPGASTWGGANITAADKTGVSAEELRAQLVPKMQTLAASIAKMPKDTPQGREARDEMIKSVTEYVTTADLSPDNKSLFERLIDTAGNPKYPAKAVEVSGPTKVGGGSMASSGGGRPSGSRSAT